MKKIILLFFILLFLNAYSQDSLEKKIDSTFIITESKLDSIIEFGLKQIGTKYVYAGTSPSGFDCSGLMYYIFKKHHIKVSRASRSLTALGKKTVLNEIKKGDFLFFKGRSLSSSRVGHVSICIEVTKDSFKMLHATDRGVVVDVFNQISYYQKRFLFAKRFLKISAP